MDKDSASLPQRCWLHHTPPSWVPDGETFFITVRCQRDSARPPDLCLPSTAEEILGAVRHYHEQQRWHIHLCLLMPDHLHALLACPRLEKLSGVIAAWKRYTARDVGVRWQKGFFDHRIRNDHSFDEKAHYIRMNPVRKGFVARPEDWPHLWPR